MLFDRLREFSQNVALGSHFRCIPFRILRIPHGETVMMFSDWTGKARAGLLEQLGPLVGIEMATGKHGDEILVAEFIQRTIRGFLMLSFIGIRLGVHVVRVPGSV